MRSYPRRLRSLAVLLAALAGFVDAIAFLQLGGFFVSFMSGNSTRLGVGLIQSPRLALIACSLILMFVAGVFLGSLAGRAAARHQRVVVLTCVTFTLAISGVLVICGLPFAATVLLPVAMGMENAAFERNGESRFGVTYMTGALVKLGQGLASAVTGGDRWTWLSYLTLWGGLVAGATGGAAAWSWIGSLAIWAAVAGAAGAALTALALGPDPAVEPVQARR